MVARVVARVVTRVVTGLGQGPVRQWKTLAHTVKSNKFHDLFLIREDTPYYIRYDKNDTENVFLHGVGL